MAWNANNLEDESEDMPYDAISERPPLEDVSSAQPTEALSNPPPGLYGPPPPPMPGIGDQVKGAIAQKMGPDPLLDNLKAQDKDLQGFAQNQLASNRISNFGQAISQAARGASAPEGNDALYSNIEKQNQQLLGVKDKQSALKQRVLEAVEGRKSREGIAAANRDARTSVLAALQGNRATTQDIAVRRSLGQVQNRINNDDIIKPSEQNMASLAKSRAILDNPNLPLTPQALADAEQDAASALTLRGPGGVTEGKIRRTEIETIGRKIAEAKQRWTGKPVDLRKETPELVEQIRKLNTALMDDYQTTIKQRKQKYLSELEPIWGDNSRYQGFKAQIESQFPQSDPGTMVAGHGSVPDAAAGGSPGSAAGGGLISSAVAGEKSGKSPVRKQYSPSRNQTKVTYADGTEEIMNGKL